MKKRKIWYSFASLLILGFLIMATYLLSEQKAENFIPEEYESDEGLIKNYGREADVEFLSESIGQYMQYLVIVGAEKEFTEQVQVLKEHFVVETDGCAFVKWRQGSQVSVNASVDDLRIMAALYEAEKLFQNPSYGKMAGQIEQSLRKYTTQDGILTEYYDWKNKIPAETAWLSYVDKDALVKMSGMNLSAYRTMLESSMTESTPFFLEIYDVNQEVYRPANEESVNMIDQLMIALQYKKIVGNRPEEFDSWLKNELDRQGKIYGGYRKSNLEPSVEFESASVYGLTVLYFIETNEEGYASRVHNLLTSQPLFSENPNYSNIHFFDYIYAKTADYKYRQGLK